MFNFSTNSIDEKEGAMRELYGAAAVGRHALRCADAPETGEH